MDRSGRPLILARLRQEAESRKRYIAQIPRWRHPLIGYLLSIPIVGLGMVVLLSANQLTQTFSFPGALLFLPILIVAFLWGTGPALLSVLLSALALDFFYFPPFAIFTIDKWEGIVRILPFIIAGVIIAIIAGQREAARRRALFAEQEVRERIFEVEQAYRQLEQADRLKDQFLSIASHELKTPITSIRGQAQIMLRRMSRQKDLPPDLEAVRTALKKIDEQTHRLGSLVEDLLDLSRIRAGKLELQLQECDLGELCREVVEDQQLISGRTIDLDLPDDPVRLQADYNRLGQVITNLLNNAIKYSAPDTPIQVEVSQHDNVAVIRVRDTGEGIPKEEQERIFEMFYRDPRAQASSKNGLGIGLAICKDIVERHGGRIWCDSLPGNGSIFVVELPLH